MDQVSRRLITERTTPLMTERRAAIRDEVTRVENHAAERGMSRSGHVTQQIERACHDEVVTRAKIAWAATKDVLAAAGVQPSDELAAELTVAVMAEVPTEDLRGLVNRRSGNDSVVQQGRAHAEQLIRSDAELYALQLRRLTEGRQAAQPVFNFHGPVGAVQTGPGAVAHINQQIGPGERDALVCALEELAEALRVATMPAGAPPREEILEVVEEARAEVQRERPNRLRIASVANGIATAVQTVAGAQAAWEAVKAALSAIGINPP